MAAVGGPLLTMGSGCSKTQLSPRVQYPFSGGAVMEWVRACVR